MKALFKDSRIIEIPEATRLRSEMHALWSEWVGTARKKLEANMTFENFVQTGLTIRKGKIDALDRSK